MSERRAALFTKMGIAHEDSAVVVKSKVPLPVQAEEEPVEGGIDSEELAQEELVGEEPAEEEIGGKVKNKPKSRRQYKRRDLQAEEGPACRKEWKRFSSSSD